MSDRLRDEAELERRLLRAIGGTPDLLLLRNEVGLGYPCGELRATLERALADHAAALAAVRAVLARARRVSYGLGVGSPDLFGAVAGRALGLELKTPSGKVETDQRQWHEAARRRGVAIFVVRSVEEGISAIGRARRGELE